MSLHDNLFRPLSDTEAMIVLSDYAIWRDTGVIPNGGFLATARDRYCELYDSHGLQILEHDLLYECTMRWKRGVEDGRRAKNR